MKFTSVYPTIIAPNVDVQLEFLKDSGFKVVHEVNDVLEKGNVEYVLENESGQRIDVVKSLTAKKDIHAIRINVDDFDACIEHLLAHNCTMKIGPSYQETHKCALLVNPDGLRLFVVNHIKK